MADKYDIPGMMELLCQRMKEDEDVGPEKIADLLITAGKYRIISSLFIVNIIFWSPQTNTTLPP